jgi:phosphomevalonate kinase
MGSSAALITSIVSALLLRLKVITREEFGQPDSNARKLAHNTAQFVHCFAQGKVGSGFDVSAAVFGSQLYTRFNPALLDGLMRGGDVSPWTCMAMLIVTLRWSFQTASGMPSLLPALSPADHWDNQTVPIQLPPLVRLVLADVSAGSSTPSLVSKVSKWRREKADEGTRVHRSPFSTR